MVCGLVLLSPVVRRGFCHEYILLYTPLESLCTVVPYYLTVKRLNTSHSLVEDFFLSLFALFFYPSHNFFLSKQSKVAFIDGCAFTYMPEYFTLLIEV